MPQIMDNLITKENKKKGITSILLEAIAGFKYGFYLSKL